MATAAPLRCFCTSVLKSCIAGVAWMATAASLRCFCTAVRKSCRRRCRLDGDGGVSTLLLHCGAQILHPQVSP